MRKPRYVPQPRTLVSITNLTIQGRYLLRPGPSFNDLFLGILGRTQRRHEMDIAAVSVLPDHFRPAVRRGLRKVDEADALITITWTHGCTN